VSPQLEISNGSAPARPDLIDRIASALPDELRADYYRELAHCRQLPENDEMLRILRAMRHAGGHRSHLVFSFIN
jgi:hypothetical protein